MLRYALFAASLMACFTLAGCGSNPADDAPQTPADAHAGHDHAAEAGHDHEHPAEGPHGGHLIELGEEQYHAEMVHDDATHTVTVYLLDAAGKEAVEADQTTLVVQIFQDGKFVDYTLQAGEQPSVFTLSDPALAEALDHEASARGRLRVAIGGTEYTGNIEHEAHHHE